MDSIILVTIGGSLLITVLVLFFVFRVIGNVTKGNKDAQRILMSGIPAQATVVGLQDTGTRLNDNPLVIIGLQVNQGAQSYQTQVRQIVPMIRMSQIQPGSNVEVRVDPADPSKVAIVFR